MNTTLVGLTGLLSLTGLGLSIDPGRTTPRPEVVVRALQTEETRRAKLAEFESHDLDPTTAVLVEFQGEELVGVTHWYGLTIDQVEDDQGNDLRIDFFGQDADGDTPEAIDREHMWFFSDEVPSDRLKLELFLGLAPRSASSIEMLSGSVTMRRATLEAFVVSGLRQKANEPIENALLEAAGVTGKIGDIDDSSIALEFSGNVGAVSAVRLLDADGENISWGTSSSSSADSKWLSISFQELPDDARIEIDVATATEDFEVPFRLDSLKLP